MHKKMNKKYLILALALAGSTALTTGARAAFAGPFKREMAQAGLRFDGGVRKISRIPEPVRIQFAGSATTPLAFRPAPEQRAAVKKQKNKSPFKESFGKGAKVGGLLGGFAGAVLGSAWADGRDGCLLSLAKMGFFAFAGMAVGAIVFGIVGTWILRSEE